MAPKVVEERRVVYLNQPERNRDRCKEFHADYFNLIRTSRYTLWSFFPRNIFEQFLRAANLYFLILFILQLIPQISSLSPVTTGFPLVFVLGVTLIKDANDDIKRHKSDAEVNNRKVSVVSGGALQEKKWSELNVGDVIQLKKNEFVPADFVIISSSSEDGDCYIETADLDGETNLKQRFSHECTRSCTDAASLATLKCEIQCNPPNNKLEDFDGTITLNNDAPVAISNKNVVLRGCRIRNTNVVNGAVVYTGNDTKLRRNAGKLRFKRTHIDIALNNLVLQIFTILLVMCILLAILSANWAKNRGLDFDRYLLQDETNGDTIGFYNFWSYLIVLSNLVPISLYVSVELIRLAQSLMIGWDLNMYHPPQNTPAVARTTTLNEELGQIEYVFSDKTGTLTQNVMRFLQCSCGGGIYGKPAVQGQPYTGFICDAMRAKLDKNDAHFADFFRLLALCHTVRPEPLADGGIDYQAQSPDEKALVEAAAEAGYVFEKRTGEDVEISINGLTETHQLLNVIEFNSTRKRMTTIMKGPDGKITAYCKGADSIIAPLLSDAAKSSDLPAVDQHLHDFAKDGLRTLVLAKRELSEEWYAAWNKKYYEADIDETPERKQKLAAVAEEVECELDLVGATAIEDKLQDGVPETIANLMRGNLKVWVLTGDKVETAINIGYSCRLLKSDMEPLFIVDGETHEQVQQQLQQAKEDIISSYQSPRPYAVVITGHALTYPLPPTESEKKDALADDGRGNLTKKWTPERLKQQKELEDLFLEVCTQCHSVLCCRVSPLQKAQVVTLVKTRKKAITLAIGDGANDVSMIKAAHVGVGISGLEGRQAVLASDYAIAQFEFLQRLLLVHGRWSYIRMAVFLRWFFYKNFAYAWCHFFFAFFCGFSALTIYDATFISYYNVIFTSLPILVIGTLEQDVPAGDGIKFPVLYEAGPLNRFFSKRTFYLSLLKGVWHAIVLFFVAYFAIRSGGQQDSEGREDADYYFLGTVLAGALVWVVNSELALNSYYYSWMNFFTLFIGPAAFFLIFSVLYEWDDWFINFQSPYFGIFEHSVGAQRFWAVFFLTLAVTMIPTWLGALAYAYFFPTPTDIVREKNLLHKGSKMQQKPFTELEPSRRQTTQSGYAFSQDENAGYNLTHHNSKASHTSQ